MDVENLQVVKGEAVSEALEARSVVSPSPFDRLPDTFKTLVPTPQDQEIAELQKEESNLWKKLLLQIAKVFSLK